MLAGLFIVLVGLFIVSVGLFIVSVGLFIVLVGLFLAHPTSERKPADIYTYYIHAAAYIYIHA